MKKTIIALLMVFSLLSCTKEKLDDTKCGPIISKEMRTVLGLPGTSDLYIIILTVKLKSGDTKIVQQFMSDTSSAQYIYNSYKIGETYCK